MRGFSLTYWHLLTENRICIYLKELMMPLSETRTNCRALVALKGLGSMTNPRVWLAYICKEALFPRFNSPSYMGYVFTYPRLGNMKCPVDVLQLGSYGPSTERHPLGTFSKHLRRLGCEIIFHRDTFF